MVGIKSDAGIVRDLNEDYAAYIEKKDYKLYIVADGMGGHNAGEVASKLAVESILEYVEEHFDIENKNLFKEAIKYANKSIYDMSYNNSEYKGMGTTITGCLILGDKIQIANVGDSCTFGIKGKEIVKITKDHSWVQELIDLGAITEEEGRVHPKKNVITRALGTTLSLEVDIFEVGKNIYDMFLLCTDGLINEVMKEEFIEIINSNNDLNNACSEMIELAKSRGGKDNITVLLFGGEV